MNANLFKRGMKVMLFELDKELFNNILLSIKRNIFLINIVYDGFNRETYKEFKHILNRIRYIGYYIDILRIEKGVITISWRYK